MEYYIKIFKRIINFNNEKNVFSDRENKKKYATKHQREYNLPLIFYYHTKFEFEARFMYVCRCRRVTSTYIISKKDQQMISALSDITVSLNFLKIYTFLLLFSN